MQAARVQAGVLAPPSLSLLLIVGFRKTRLIAEKESNQGWKGMCVVRSRVGDLVAVFVMMRGCRALGKLSCPARP